MKLKNYFIVVALCSLAFSINAQQASNVGPTDTGMLSNPIIVPSIAEQIQNGTFKYAEDNSNKKGKPKLKIGNRIVPGKGTPASFRDPLADLQDNSEQRLNRSPLQTFTTTTSTSTPSDPTGVVGPNHYLAAWNTSFRIFDKSGAPLTPAASLATIFPGNAIGDPIVFFDADVDNGAGEPRGRFVITEFDNAPNGFNVAVSQGPDPVNDGWFVYTTGFGTVSFPDYTKFAVWADSYIVTANISNSNRVFAVERLQMINGDPAGFQAFPLPGIITSGFYSPHAFHTTDDQLAAPGTPAPIVYMQDDAWGGVSEDHLKIWNLSVDWATPSNSTISTPQVIETTPFIGVFDGGSFSNLDQPSGPDIDALQATIMNQAQYRRFGTHNSAVFNFVVDVVGAPGQGLNEKAGIRWYELRQSADGQPWEIFQEGTYTSPTGNKDAFAASMAMNSNGDIGMGYTTVSDSERIAIQFTGRLASDPLNIMTAGENLIVQGTANNPSLRYADYTHLTVDPVDDTFWHVSEYFGVNRRNQVGQFEIAPALANDIGVISIDSPVDGGVYTDVEPIVITIRNFGTNDISNPEVQYSIDGGTPVVENFDGTIASGTSESYTFNQTADLSDGGNIVIQTSTNLAGDTNPNNDPFKVSIDGTGVVLNVEEASIAKSDLIVVTLPNNKFDISLKTSFEDVLTIEVINSVGQTVAFNNIEKGNDGYSYNLDMSYAASGVYILRLGDQVSGVYQTAKIIVK